MLPTARRDGHALSVVGRARVYVCGVTPYDVTHLGHAATYVWVDAVDRLLRRLGVAVEVRRNVTDVDDVLFAAADRAGQHYDQMAAVQQFHFERDMDALGVRRPAHEPRAHSFVPQVVGLASALLSSQPAYTAAGSVYLPGAGVAEAAGLTRSRLWQPWPPPTAGSTTRPSATRSTRRCGSAASRESPPGPARGARADPAGTPSAPRWRCRPTAQRWTYMPAAPT